MWKLKLRTQIIICAVITAAYGIVHTAEIPWLNEKSAAAVAVISKHYTISDIADTGKAAVSNLVEIPSAVTSSIMSSQEQQEYGIPLDDLKDGETGSVYAVAGGMVTETGENDDIGLYIKIAHENAVSVYGNCDKSYVKEGEHVRKGQVIAGFTKDKEFYYRLHKNE